ncbi:GNAT family N-acetyltransferase [Paenibacillus donghaensis]|uniref:GNAT family N-acetyltransferase n=1 Tax=Paenibacillus donghaensis TaxID=414771 RepID=A0A2Z2KMV8_9BACL|nr:GNAT family N-acetyltransferase [Paenibacillus donghaensis]ASA23909.1 GNAT family N-acetyltransferase [Paenibacillus donghaensis]
MSSRIRQAVQEELDEIMELIALCVQVMQAGGSDQWDETYPNRDIIGADIAQGNLYIYQEGAAIAGILALDENQAEEYKAIDWSVTEGPHLLMHRLAVHPQVQGKGIARKLINFAEDYALQGGYTSMRMDTYAKNEKILALYPRLGYERRGEFFLSERKLAFPVFEKRLSQKDKL